MEDCKWIAENTDIKVWDVSIEILHIQIEHWQAYKGRELIYLYKCK